MAHAQTHTEDTVAMNMIKECNEVAHWASSCAVRCIESTGEEMDVCARVCLDASDVSSTLAALTARGSASAGRMADCTKMVLSDCAAHCDMMADRSGDGRRTMETCAAACRRAAESVEAFIGTGR